MTSNFYFVKGTKMVVQATGNKNIDNTLPAHAYFQKPNGELIRAKKLDGNYVKHMLIPVPEESIEIN